MPEVELDNFADNLDDYYVAHLDYTIEDPNGNVVTGVKLQQNGIELLSEYHAKKFNACIYFPQEKMQSFDLYYYSSRHEFFINFKKHLADAKLKFGITDTETEYRIAFFIGLKELHAIPFIYIKENNIEGILYADSLGVDTYAAKTLAEHSGVPVYITEKPRQVSRYGCKTDARLFCRDVTGKDPKTNEYLIPNFLSELKLNSIDRGTHFAAKLPLELLKTSQFSKFTKFHSQGQVGRKIKNKTLEEFLASNTDYSFTLFRERESMDHKTYTEERGVNLLNYLRNKTLKDADKIEVLFYLNQIEKKLENFSDEDRLDFIKRSKEVLKSQGHVKPDNERKGLHQFAMDYVAEFETTKKCRM